MNIIIIVVVVVSSLLVDMSGSCRVAGERSGGSMPEWVLTDLQQRLNAAQQLLDNRSMGHNQGHLAETWPRARPRSPAGKGEYALIDYSALALDCCAVNSC